jgi:hypothetical protein
MTSRVSFLWPDLGSRTHFIRQTVFDIDPFRLAVTNPHDECAVGRPQVTDYGSSSS